MSARRPEPPDPAEPRPGRLVHNPFAALRGDGARPVPSIEQPRSGSARAAADGDRIVVRREKKGRGGKAVTIAEGAGLASADLETLAREAAKALGAGARVEDGAIVVQGEQTERLITWLSSHGFVSVTRGN
jgi:translation initiation factor 1